MCASPAVLGARYGDDLPKAPVFNPATAAVGEVGIVDSDQGNRQRGLDSLADALSRGATAEEVRELARVGQRQRQKMSLDKLAGGRREKFGGNQGSEDPLERRRSGGGGRDDRGGRDH